MSWNPPQFTTPPPPEEPAAPEQPAPAPESAPAAPEPAPAPESAQAPAPTENPTPQAEPDAASTSATTDTAAPAGPATYTVTADDLEGGLAGIAEKLGVDANALAYFHGKPTIAEGDELRVPAEGDYTTVPADATDLAQLHGEETMKVFAVNYGRWQPASPRYLSHPDQVEGGWILELPK